MANRVVLAYSGGLDTSVAISWIAKETGAEVVAVAIDLGQGGEDMDTVRQLKDCAEQIQRGELAGEPLPDGSARTLPEAARIYRLGDVALIV